MGASSSRARVGRVCFSLFLTAGAHSVPGQFSSAIGLSVHTTSTCDNQFPEAIVSWANGICVSVGLDSYSAGCSYGNMYVWHFTSSNVCFGPGYYYQIREGCTQVPPHWDNFPLVNVTGKYLQTQCNPPCFHADSHIKSPVTGATMTLESLRKGEHPECHIPHELKADGVKLSTTCSERPLRVTNDHLIFVPTGQVEAVTLKVGDELFTDGSRQERCRVTAVEQEVAQPYFGLNCKHSRVVADGVYASTFGRYHLLPELWMTYASKVLGVQRASVWGDKIVTFLSHIGLH